MKPIPQIEPHLHRTGEEHSSPAARKLPVIDHSYQLTAEAVEELSTAANTSVARPRPFHQISGEVLGWRRNREYQKEAIAFAAICGIAAWSIGAFLYLLADILFNAAP